MAETLDAFGPLLSSCSACQEVLADEATALDLSSLTVTFPCDSTFPFPGLKLLDFCGNLALPRATGLDLPILPSQLETSSTSKRICAIPSGSLQSYNKTDFKSRICLPPLKQIPFRPHTRFLSLSSCSRQLLERSSPRFLPSSQHECPARAPSRRRWRPRLLLRLVSS